MAALITGEVLGPRPICSFWQGKVEIGLRVAEIVVSVYSILLSSFCYMYIVCYNMYCILVITSMLCVCVKHQ